MVQQDFVGRKIMVFGASSGIGRMCAIQLGERGASVVLVGRNRERLEETASHIPKEHRIIIPCDVSDFDAAEAVVRNAVKLDGVRLYGCVFSVGIAPIVPVAAVKEPLLLKSFQTNLFSLYGILKAFSSRRVSLDGASFVSISSLAALGPIKGQCIYAATKAAINTYTCVAAKELAQRKIRVNTVCPEMVDTPMGHDRLGNLSSERLQSRYPMGALRPEDIADTVIFLLSSASRKITGQAVAITAGSTGGSDNFEF